MIDWSPFSDLGWSPFWTSFWNTLWRVWVVFGWVIPVTAVITRGWPAAFLLACLYLFGLWFIRKDVNDE